VASARAKERQGTRTDLELPEKFTESEKGEALDKVAASVGWTQEEIAEAMGLKRNTISEIVGKFPIEEIDTFLSKGKTDEELAEFFQLDLTLTWALPGPI
jgi:transcriptional regulator with XRE-family HTH domain